MLDIYVFITYWLSLSVELIVRTGVEAKVEVGIGTKARLGA